MFAKLEILFKAALLVKLLCSLCEGHIQFNSNFLATIPLSLWVAMLIFQETGMVISGKIRV